MGMGEPLYNFDNVRDAMAVVADGDGLAISRRRITLSTSGVVPEIPRWGEEAGTMLAISLHAVRDELRDKLVPINRKYPIAELMAACRAYPGLSNARRITFEYVMLKGVNDSLADARALVRLLAGIPAKINLIPFNPWPGTAHECSDWEQIESSPKSSTGPAMPAPSAPRAAATSWPPAGSSNRRASNSPPASALRWPALSQRAASPHAPGDWPPLGAAPRRQPSHQSMSLPPRIKERNGPTANRRARPRVRRAVDPASDAACSPAARDGRRSAPRAADRARPDVRGSGRSSPPGRRRARGSSDAHGRTEWLPPGRAGASPRRSRRGPARPIRSMWAMPVRKGG